MGRQRSQGEDPVREVSAALNGCDRDLRIANITSSTSLDYLFQLAVEMHKLGLPWISQVEQIAPQRS